MQRLGEIVASKGCQSPLEKKLFSELVRMGVKFEIQYPIDIFFADFAFPDKRLILEVDGKEAHEGRKLKDRFRDKKLSELGWKTVRYPGWFVYRYPDACVGEIVLRYFPEMGKQKALAAITRYFVRSGQNEIGEKLTRFSLTEVSQP